MWEPLRPGAVLGRQGGASLELQQGGQHKFSYFQEQLSRCGSSKEEALLSWFSSGGRGISVWQEAEGENWQPRSPEVRVKGSFLQSTSQHRGGWPSLLFPHGVQMLPFSVEKLRQTQSRNLQSNSSTFSYFELFAYFYYQSVVKNLPGIINLLLLHDRK